MEIQITTRMVLTKASFVTIEGREYEVDSVLEALDCLDDTDCLFGSCIMDGKDSELGEALERLGVAFQCTKGGYRKAHNYLEFHKALVKALVEATGE